MEALAFLSDQVSSVRFGPHLFDAESNLAPTLLAFRALLKAQREANHLLIMERQAALVHGNNNNSSSNGAGAGARDPNFMFN